MKIFSMSNRFSPGSGEDGQKPRQHTAIGDFIMLKTLFSKPRAPKRPVRNFDQISREWTSRDWADLPVHHPRQS